MKKANPIEAYQKARMSVLQLLMESKDTTWQGLWKLAKAKGMNYNTFKKHMETLKKEEIVKTEIREGSLPPKMTFVFDREKLDLEGLFIEDLLKVVNNGIRKRTFRLDDLGWIILTEEKEAIENLFRPMETEDPREVAADVREYFKLQSLIAETMSILADRRKQVILRKMPLEKRRTVLKYEENLFQFVNLYYRKDLLGKFKDERHKELLKGIFTPSSLKEALKETASLKEDSHWKGMTLTEWPKKKLEEKTEIERFLTEHETEYEAFRKKLDMDSKIAVLLPVSGFYGYKKRRDAFLRSLPPELALTFQYRNGELTDEQLRELALRVHATVQRFGKRKTGFVCGDCFELFRKQQGCMSHMKRTHQGTEKEPKRIHSAYYSRILSVINSLLNNIRY